MAGRTHGETGQGFQGFCADPVQDGGKKRSRTRAIAHKKAALKDGFSQFALKSGDQTRRSTIIFLISAIALAGFRPFGQAWEQFMIVWQR